MQRRLLIEIEGLDASGKGTQVALLADAISAARLKFPTYETPVGQAIKAVLIDGAPDPLVLQALCLMNRFEWAHDIAKDLTSRSVVLDRYILSAIVYGAGDGLDRDWLWKLHELLPQPDLHILIDIPVEESFKRRPERQDAYEANVCRMTQVREEYLRVWHKPYHHRAWNGTGVKWVIVDGTQSVAEVHQVILNIVKHAKG